jgi:hypothetical protein
MKIVNIAIGFLAVLSLATSKLHRRAPTVKYADTCAMDCKGNGQSAYRHNSSIVGLSGTKYWCMTKPNDTSYTYTQSNCKDKTETDCNVDTTTARKCHWITYYEGTTKKNKCAGFCHACCSSTSTSGSCTNDKTGTCPN